MKLKTEQIALLRAILVTQMNHWIFFPVYVTSIVILHDIVNTGTPYILLWLALGCLPFLLYVGRQKIQKFWQFIILHCSVIGVMFLIPTGHIAIKVLYVLVGVLYAVYSCYIHFKTKERQDPKMYPAFSIGISLIMLYALHHLGNNNWDTVYVTVLIVTLGLYFIIYYIEQYQNFLKVNHSSAGHIPAKEMFQSGMSLVLGYTAVGILILVLISNMDWLKSILNVIKKALWTFLYWIMSLFPKSGPVSMDGPTEAATIANMNDMIEMFEGGESSWIWGVVEYIFGIIFIIAFVLILVKCMIFVVKFIKSKMKAVSFKDQSDSAEAVVDVREKCDIKKDSERKLKLPFLPTSPKERIRHMYKKRILASKTSFDTGKKPEYYTARESSRILERDELFFAYEKARYSDAECDNNDVKRMRNACK